VAVQRSNSTFGLTDAEWQTAIAELRAAILKAAADRRMTSYGEIAPQVTVVHVDAFSPLMNHLLGAIFREEHEAGRPALTALVTHKHGDKEPGPGFYDMARELGISFDEPYVYWSTQVQEVFKLHGRPARPRRARRPSD
jgi:hypothetical protein